MIGKMHHRVAIQAKSGGDDWGDVAEAWTTADTVWADLRQLSGAELVTAQQVDDKTTHAARIRHYPTLTTRHRLLHKTEIYHILGIVADAKLRWMDVTIVGTGEVTA